MEVRVESIAAGGDGVARSDGLVVFIPRSAPGDVARVTVTQAGRFARGVLTELLTASPDRVEAPCQHYRLDGCGGCQLQHLRYEAQLDAKSRIIGDAFQRIARRPIASPEVRVALSPWRYRRKLTLALRRDGGRWFAGLHRYDDPTQVFRLEDCLITDEGVMSLWREVMAAAVHFPDAQSLRGAVRRDGEAGVFLLEGGMRWAASDRFFAAAPSLTELWWKAEGRSPRLLHRRGAADATGASFAQVNPAVAAALHAHVLQLVLSHRPEAVVDAYSGVGDLAAELSAHGVRVTAIEIDRAAAARAAERVQPGSRVVAGSVEGALPAVLPTDVVVLNPPRGGVAGRVTELLDAGEPRPRAVVYASCDPATLARDVARLTHYRVASLLAFDMFPQTAHVETVCELVPERT